MAPCHARTHRRRSDDVSRRLLAVGFTPVNCTVEDVPLDIEQPRIFPKEIIAGVTAKNLKLFPGKGFSATPCPAFTREEAQTHRALLARFLGVSSQSLCFQNQVHGDCIVEVGKDSVIQVADGMISREPGLFLCVSVADCAAVLLYEAEQKVIAVAHSGWRGAVANIAGKAIEMMVSRYDARRGEILAYISPCASGKRYEVGEEVAELFPRNVRIRREDGKWLLDIRLHIRHQLGEAGVREQNIEVSPACTIAEERYHSYRRDGNQSGRMAVFIGRMPRRG